MPEIRREAQVLLQHALSIGALEFIPEGRKLKSGRISPYFFNSALFRTGIDANLLMAAYVAAVTGHPEFESIPFQVVYGPPYKGIPLAYGFAMEHGGELEWASSRKEAKDHGEGGLGLGASLEGKRVLIIDDVSTTGESLLEAARYVTSQNGIVVGCVVGFDRQEQVEGVSYSACQWVEMTLRVPVVSAANLGDLILLLKEGGSPMLAPILQYREQYGA